MALDKDLNMEESKINVDKSNDCFEHFNIQNKKDDSIPHESIRNLEGRRRLCPFSKEEVSNKVGDSIPPLKKLEKQC